MSPEELSDLIALGIEQTGIEFKGARPRSDRLFTAKVTRAALGMSNRRNGGLIIIGVEETSSGLDPAGLSPDDVATWRSDLIADTFAQYAEPPISFTAQVVSHAGKPFVVLSVGEFRDTPTLCRRSYQAPDGNAILREGACYVRPRRKPETTEVPTYADMRDLLDLAVEKGLRRYLESARAVGLSPTADTSSRGPSDREMFEAQRKGLA